MDKVIRYWDFGTKVLKSTATFATSMICLEKTVASLRTKKDELIAIREDVKMKVQVEVEQGKMMSKQVEDWMKRVEETENKVNEVLAEHQDIRNHGLVFRFGSTCKLGPRSLELLDVIQELLSNLKYLELTIQRPRPAPTRETEGWREIPLGSHNLVGCIESHLEKVLTWLKNDNVGIIGLYGMGGVGKTTLLNNINNRLPKNGNDAFDCALWVLASGNATIETIQQDVLSKVGMASSSRSGYEVRNDIYNTLKNKKYILMLDDVWEMLDLFEGVGIPKPDNQNRSKIIFTSRLKGVCAQMKAQEIIRVEGLPWEEAWSLFEEKVGKATLSPRIEIHAKKVARECDGLPLALITIGSAMSGKVEPCEWSHALDQLQNYPAEIPDLDKQVFPKLRLSFDYLADSTKQKCFLYCSLFPEDWKIEPKELVNLWMGEGYLNKKHDIKKAYDYGYSIIEDLKRACLLESVESGSDLTFEIVKMHDMVRDMALWIAKKEFLVVDKAEIMRAKSNDQYWNGDVKKMSLWTLETFLYKIEEGNSSEGDQEMLIPSRECPNLSTLLIKVSPEDSLWRLMNFIPNVRVLSFSGMRGLRELPEGISKLENLEYLDMSYTSIRRLPKEMKSLTKLRYLLMNYTFVLSRNECPAEIISNLTELLVFHVDIIRSTEQLLRGLEKLQNIKSIEIWLDSPKTMNYWQKSEKLQLCTTSLVLKNQIGEELELSPTNMRILESLSIAISHINVIKCKNPNKLMNFNCLGSVWVYKCHGLKELDILAYAPSLIRLIVHSCKSINRIIQGEEAKPVFGSLKQISLVNLYSLETISNWPLSFPNLKRAKTVGCFKLKQTFGKESDPNTSELRIITRWFTLTPGEIMYTDTNVRL